MAVFVQVRGGYRNATGGIVHGTISFRLTAALNDPAANLTYEPVPTTAQLSAGNFSVTLLATKDNDLTPAGVMYEVTEAVDGAPARTWYLDVDEAWAGAGVDLADVAPSLPGELIYTYATQDDIANHAGGVDPHGDRAYTVTQIGVHAGATDPHGDRAYTDGVALGLTKIPVTADQTVFVSPRGDDAWDGLTLGTAKLTLAAGLAALSGPGTIQLAAGTISTGGQINLDGRVGVTIQGMGGATAGASPATIVSHSGSGATAVISMRSSYGCKLVGFMLLCTNAGFTGDVIDLRLTSSSTSLWQISDLYIGGTGGCVPASGINCGNSQDGIIAFSNIVGCTVGIKGRSIAGDFSNAIVVWRSRFSGATTASVQNIGEGWMIGGCNFAAIAGGKAGAILNGAGIVARGVFITGNWFGDVTAAAGGTQISMPCVGLNVTGNFIGFNTTATGVAIGDNSVGVRVNANRFEAGNSGDTGISIGTGVADYDVGGNNYQSVATPISGGSVEQHRAAVDMTAAYRWQNNAGTDILSVNTLNGRVGALTGAPNSALHVAGPIATAQAAITGATTLGGSHSTVECTAAAPYSVTLPSAVGIAGREYTAIKTDNNANLVTLATTSAQTINGAATYTGLNAQWKYVTVRATAGGHWIIVGSN